MPRKSPKSKSAAAANNAAEARIRRRNHAKQSQLNKRASLVSATRLFAGTHGAPRIIAVIPLTEDANARQITTCLAEVLDTPSDTIPEKGVWGMRQVISSYSLLDWNSHQSSAVQDQFSVYQRPLQTLLRSPRCMQSCGLRRLRFISHHRGRHLGRHPSADTASSRTTRCSLRDTSCSFSRLQISVWNSQIPPLVYPVLCTHSNQSV